MKIKDVIKKGNYLLIDLRMDVEFEEGTVGDAINIEPYMLESHREFILNEPRDIVFFCDGGLLASEAKYRFRERTTYAATTEELLSLV